MSEAGSGLASEKSEVGWYMGGLASWFVGAGAQGTLFPWLIAVALGESALRVGTAQTLAMLPPLALVLLGGALADRHDGRGLLVGLHALAALPPLALAGALMWGSLGYGAVIAYAMAMGTIAAFVIPVRDSLLSRVAGRGLQRTVTLSILVQVASQIIGTVVGGTAATIGATSVLLFQAAASTAGAVAFARLTPAPPTKRTSTAGGLSEIREGISVLLRTPSLLPVTLLNVAIGVLFLGAILVAMPLLVRDVYGGSSFEIAAINGSMMLGMFAGTGGLLARGGLERQGRALILSLCAGGVALGAVALGPPLPVVYGLIFLFGVGGGIAIPAGRTLVQAAAPETHRARILSLYSLGFMGAAPIGAFGMGALADAVGPLPAMLLPGGGMLFANAAILAASDTWNFRVSAEDTRGRAG